MFLPNALAGQYYKVYAGVNTASQAFFDRQSEAAVCAGELFDAVREAADTCAIMGVTEHQLLTNGGSDTITTAGFDIDITPEGLGQVRELAEQMAKRNRGLCICMLPIPMENPVDGIREDIATHADRGRFDRIKTEHLELIRFGQKMKREGVSAGEISEVEEAFDDIVVFGDPAGKEGALAAIGLRIGGDDGRFVGTYDMTGFSTRKYGSVAMCIGGFRGVYGIDVKFADRTGSRLGFHEHLVLINNAKGILDNGEFTILCTLGNDDMWLPYGPDDFNRVRKHDSCDFFELDNDCIERFKETKKRACSSCLYRKLTEEGYSCTVGHVPVR